MSEIQVTYCGHSTVIIETQGGKRVIFDPFLEGNPLCPEELKSPSPIDYICLTHGHADHASSAAPLAKATGAVIFATYELGILMIKEGVPESQVQLMNKGGTVEIPDSGGLKVTLTNAFHSSLFDASDGNTYYAGEACGIIFTLESGRNIYHLGDTSLFSDLEKIARQYRPDLAFVPIGDRFTMGPIAAAKATALVRAKTVIPVHHSTFPLLSGTPKQFTQNVIQLGLESKVVVLEPGETRKL